MTNEQMDVIRDLKNAGYAVLVLYPEEVGTADPRRVEDRLAELSVEIVQDLED